MTPDPTTTTHAGGVPRPTLDVTPHTALAICPVRSCSWRGIEPTQDIALLRYHTHYAQAHRSHTAAQPCSLCGAPDDVMPRRGICRRCHRAERAAKARTSYAQTRRAS